MPHFRPIGKLVKSRVRFTKTLYAMLSSEDFYPDSKLNWNFPSTNSSDFKAYSFGAKLVMNDCFNHIPIYNIGILSVCTRRLDLSFSLPDHLRQTQNLLVQDVGWNMKRN